MSEVLLRVIDCETTGLKPPEAEIVEWGWTDVLFDTETKTVTVRTPESRLFCPVNGIPPEMSAVHHLTMQHVQGEPTFQPGDIEGLVGPADFVVAHNWAFEGQWVTADHLGPRRPICTFKAACRIWPEAPSKSNSALRYWRRLDLNEGLAMPPHRAGPDSYVTAFLLADMLRTETVANLVRWTREPRFLPKCPIGKHKDTPWGEIPADYLQWITRAADMDPDVVHAAKTELQSRQA